MSAQMDALRTVIRKMSEKMFRAKEINVQKIREVLGKSYAQQALEAGVTQELGNYGDVPVAVFTPAQQTCDHWIYYVHGGGLVTGDRLTAGPYASQLALASGCRVLTCSYRLAPEHPYPAGLEDAYTVYQQLGANHPASKISLIGESGGAYLALAIALKVRDAGAPLPASLVLNSVVADLSGKIHRENTAEETTVSVEGLAQLARLYAPEADWCRPAVSPVYGDFRKLPPLRIVYDRDEVLAVDSQIIAQKAKAAGVQTQTAEYVGCFHGFATTGWGTPESSQELEKSVRFMMDSFQAPDEFVSPKDSTASVHR